MSARPQFSVKTWKSRGEQIWSAIQLKADGASKMLKAETVAQENKFVRGPLADQA